MPIFNILGTVIFLNFLSLVSECLGKSPLGDTWGDFFIIVLQLQVSSVVFQESRSANADSISMECSASLIPHENK